MEARWLDRGRPLLDRIDLQIEIARVPFDDMVRRDGAERSPVIRERLVAARAIARERFAGTPIGANAEIPPSLMRTYCALDDGCVALGEG